MNLGKLAPLALGGLILAGGLATASLAQQPPLPATAMPGHGDKAGSHDGMRHADPAERAARRAEHLRAALQLRPDQEAALKAFLGAHQPPAGERGKFRERRGEMAQMTTPQRLDAQKARMAEHQARFEQHAAATKRFYAQLSPAQQKAFDALGPRGGRGGHGGGRHHGRMGERG
ncbi:Spy/CpxP family protein refolding chaperone [Phenylobacterium sp.]|uniref:Spy/CpxP family protein refolding chaperone n=1 Tax=Phenylobacterium sp. TaxID=1871053 RepID=UPI0027354AD2|nr:Spy/CpxP family protein refolding chaperone [Phenylobacterium sp.]MDP3852187.1 Spy/CpxP family protein refolding chaperone [Phenylobacterium sp.]